MHQLTDEELYIAGQTILNAVALARAAHKDAITDGRHSTALTLLSRQATLLSALRKIVAAAEIPAAPAEAA